MCGTQDRGAWGTHIHHVHLPSQGELLSLHVSGLPGSPNWSPVPLDTNIRAHKKYFPVETFCKEKKKNNPVSWSWCFIFWPMLLDEWVFWEAVCGNRSRRWRSWHFKDVFCTQKKSSINTFWIHEFVCLYWDIFLIEIQGLQLYGYYAEIQDMRSAGEEQVLFPGKTPTALVCIELLLVFCSWVLVQNQYVFKLALSLNEIIPC